MDEMGVTYESFKKLDKIKLRKSRKWNLEKIESTKVEKVGNNGILESRISEI